MPTIHQAVSSALALWTRTPVVIESNPGQIKTLFSCNRRVVLTKSGYTMVLYLLKFCNRTSLYVTAASGASVDPTSQVCSSAILALPIAEDFEIWFCVSPQWHKFHTKFHLNSSICSSVESCRRTDGYTWPAVYAFISCLSSKESKRSSKGNCV
jgi:hypothetical protein